jgi:hypothetical protein
MRVFVVLALLIGLSGPAWAQEPAAPAVDSETFDATKLGVSLSRIQKGLRMVESKEKTIGDGLRLDISIQVFGTSPKIELFKEVDLFSGPVPGSAPTHQEYLQFVTPQIYRTPSMPISSLAAWVGQWMWQQNKKSRCEEEIANYRALVMQGVNVSAPRCTQ